MLLVQLKPMGAPMHGRMLYSKLLKLTLNVVLLHWDKEERTLFSYKQMSQVGHLQSLSPNIVHDKSCDYYTFHQSQSDITCMFLLEKIPSQLLQTNSSSSKESHTYFTCNRKSELVMPCSTLKNALIDFIEISLNVVCKISFLFDFVAIDECFVVFTIERKPS